MTERKCFGDSNVRQKNMGHRAVSLALISATALVLAVLLVATVVQADPPAETIVGTFGTGVQQENADDAEASGNDESKTAPDGAAADGARVCIIEMTNGDKLQGELVSIRNGELEIRPTVARNSTFKLKIEMLTEVSFDESHGEAMAVNSPAAAAAAATAAITSAEEQINRLRQMLGNMPQEVKPSICALRLKNESVILGSFENIEADALSFRGTELGLITVARPLISELVFDAGEFKSPVDRPLKLHTLITDNGDTLHGHLEQLDPETLRVFDASVEARIKVANVVGIAFPWPQEEYGPESLTPNKENLVKLLAEAETSLAAVQQEQRNLVGLMEQMAEAAEDDEGDAPGLMRPDAVANFKEALEELELQMAALKKQEVELELQRSKLIEMIQKPAGETSVAAGGATEDASGDASEGASDNTAADDAGAVSQTVRTAKPAKPDIICTISGKDGTVIIGKNIEVVDGRASLDLAGNRVVVSLAGLNKIGFSTLGDSVNLPRQVLVWGAYSDADCELRTTMQVLPRELGDRWKVVLNKSPNFDAEFEAQLRSSGVLLIPEQDRNWQFGSRELGEKLRPLVRAHLRRGGKVIVCGPMHQYLDFMRASELMTLQIVGQGPNGMPANFTPAGRWLARDIGQGVTMAETTTLYRAADPSERVSVLATAEMGFGGRHGNGSALILSRKVDRGTVIVMGQDYYNTNDSLSKVLRNAVVEKVPRK